MPSRERTARWAACSPPCPRALPSWSRRTTAATKPLAFALPARRFEVAQTAQQLRQPVEDRTGLEPGAVVDRGIAGHHRPRVHGGRDPRLRGRDHAIAHGDVPGHADLAGEGDAVADAR